AHAAWAATWDGIFEGAARAAQEVEEAYRWLAPPDREAAIPFYHEADNQAALLRDIFGNPSRPVRIKPDWWYWRQGLIYELALTIYEDRAFDRMPVLADTLEEVGCPPDDPILTHLRGAGPHTRGCHVLDALLGRS